MRQGSGIPLTIAISAIVHVAIFGAARWIPDPPRIHRDSPITIELVPPTPVAEIALAAKPEDVPPIDVVFLDSDPIDEKPIDQSSIDQSSIDQSRIDPKPVPRPAPDRSIPSDAVAISTVPGSTSSEVSPDTSPSPDRNRYLDMRRAPSPRIAVRGWDDLEHVPRGTTPEKDISTGQLAPDGGGTRKSDQGAFTAKVDKDGTVKLKDKKNFNIHIMLPSAKDLGDMIQAWYYDPNKPVGTLGPPKKPPRQAHLTREDVSGAERLYDDDSALYGTEKDPHPGDGGGTVAILGGGFDITDAFMRDKGIDPYASKKLAFLDSTRDERVQIGKKYKTQQLAQVAQIVKKNLSRVWAATKDPQQRKQALFEMWDECVETGSEEVVQAAATARKMIVGFMRANFPAGGAHEFTTAEIAACNRAKQSSATFAPYE